MKLLPYIFICFLLTSCSQKQNLPIVLEQRVTVATIVDDKLPHLPPLVTTPLPCEAVGIESVLEKFEPILYLAQPTPRFGGSSSFFESGSRHTFKVYRGINEIASKNKFLGEFEIVGPGDPAQAVEAMVGFKVTDQQLLLSVTDMTGEHVMNVRRVDESSGQ